MLPVLIVDDAHEDALLVKRVFSQCKILNPTFLLNGGDACYDYFEGADPFSNRALPCIVFLDMIMAPISGLDVLAKLRSDGWLAKGSMVVMMSGLTDIKAVHQGYQLGAKTFLIKPLEVEDVMQMITSITSLKTIKRNRGYELVLDQYSTASEQDTSEIPLPSGRLFNTSTTNN